MLGSSMRGLRGLPLPRERLGDVTVEEPRKSLGVALPRVGACTEGEVPRRRPRFLHKLRHERLQAEYLEAGIEPHGGVERHG